MCRKWLLEPCAVKVASTVLRGGGGGNVAPLPDRWFRCGLACCRPFRLPVPEYPTMPRFHVSPSSNRTCGFLASGSPTGFTNQHTATPDDGAFAGQYSRFRDRRTH